MAPSLHRRSAGLLLHISSLPGPHGIGDLGPEAYRFADFLAAARQTWWQMLPVEPVEGSPYASFSAFAGNQLFISLEVLCQQGLLSPGEIQPLPGTFPLHYDFPSTAIFKVSRLWEAFLRFEKKAPPSEKEAFEIFCRENASWLDDFALFFVLKGVFQGEPWPLWDKNFRNRDPQELNWVQNELAREINSTKFNQFLFVRQWEALHDYCRQLGLGLIGDLPIYVAHDSADVWANQALFFLDAKGQPTVVSGVPPDYFSKTGQRWGNPLYRWDLLRERDYGWWFARLRQTFRRFDAVRIDHFIAFHRYWEIPASEPTAVNGSFQPGPGAHFFERALEVLGELPLIAEDLGIVTPEVRALRDRFSFPGMRVLQFAFGNPADTDNDHLPYNHPRSCLVYTGTHDNDTTAGWWKKISPAEREFVKAFTGGSGREMPWTLIREAYRSVANVTIIPVQDLLGLGSEARMNKPGTIKGNWGWRMAPGALTKGQAAKLSGLCETFGRGR